MNEACSRRGVDNGNPTSWEVEERRLYDVRATREEEDKACRILASNAVAGGIQQDRELNRESGE